MHELTDERLTELRTIASNVGVEFDYGRVDDDNTETVAEWMSSCSDDPGALAAGRLWAVYAPTDEREGLTISAITGDGENAQYGTWSMACGWIVSNIVEAHSVTSTWTPDTAIVYGPLLLDGIYEAITGIPVSEETLTGCRDYFAKFPERHVFAGSAAEAKKAAEEARRELAEAARGEE